MADVLKLFLEISVMASVMTGIVLAIRRFFSKRMGPAVMLLLWGMILVRLCLPFTFESPVRFAELLPEQPATVITEEAPLTADQTTGTSAGLDMNTALANTQAAMETPQAAAGTASGEAADKTLADLLKEIPVWSLLAAIWIAGAAATLYLSLYKALRFKKKLSFCNSVTDAGILKSIRLYKRDMGVKKAVALLECDFIHAPAVFGYFKPCILIPSRFIRNMDKKSLDAILLHELCHIKSHDILMNYAWLAAKALHWFNPLVWMAYRCFEDDVEICRDQSTARMLSAGGAAVYSESLVKAARFSKKTSFIPSLGTTLFENKNKLKQRIIRLMNPLKKTKSAVAVSALLAMLMTVACFTTACQPTPEKPFVISKQDNPVLEAAQEDSGENAQEMANDKKVIEEQIEKLGGHLQMEMEPNPKVTIKVDAEIVLPEYDRLPLVRVQPKNFSREQFDTLATLLTGGQSLYYADMQSPWSKEEISAALIKLKGYAANQDLPSYIKNNVDYSIDFMEEEYEKSGSKADEKPYDGTLTEQENNSTFSTVTQLKCYMGKDIAARLILSQSFNETQTSMLFDNNDYGSAYNTFEPYTGTDAERIDITFEEAKAMAEDFVRKVDGEDSNLAIVESSIGYQIDTFENYTHETSPQAYAFSFARSYDGVPVKHVGYLFGANENVDYTRQVAPESLSVVIDDQGINTAVWQNNTETIEKVSDDMPLKDFDSILEIFEQHCKQKFTWMPRNDALVGEDQNATLNVKRVELNMMAIPEKDNLENYITVPVWDFIADMKYDEPQAAQDGYPVFEEQDVSILTINAVDGSIIDRMQGY